MNENDRAVFLSYAKQDAAAAARICAALRDAGVTVWFDESELRGGDAWDASIRRHIKSCALFLPILSRNTQSRAEGYFRLEWKLAIDRSHLMAHDRTFLLPVAIDDTPEDDERVPERLRDLQWSRLPAGQPTPAFVERVRQLLSKPERVAHPSPVPDVVPAALAEATPDSRPSRVQGSRTRMVLAAIATAMLVAGAGLWFTRQAWQGPAAVEPYSAQDRRMTFAILPFEASTDDERGRKVAQAVQQALLGNLESRPDFGQIAAHAVVEQAAAKEVSMKKLAQELDVHFLVRGTVSKSPAGYNVSVSVVDGQSERVLRSMPLEIAADALTPRWRDDLDDVAYRTLFAGMEAEARRNQDKPAGKLDVRDLTFRAWSQWRTNRASDGKNAYASATDLLKQALALAPEDPLAIFATANINLCDCVNAWSENPDEQTEIGAAAMDRYLQIDPRSDLMLANKASYYQLRGRFEDSLVIADTLLAADPGSANGLVIKARGLLRLGRAQEALPLAESLFARYPNDWAELPVLLADIRFALQDYAGAAKMARVATAQLKEWESRNRIMGAVRLTMIAAEARQGNMSQAKVALEDFVAAVPNATTITAMKNWIHPSANLADFAPLYEGLRLAGVPE